MSLAVYFSSYRLHIFRTLMYTSSGACDVSVELQRRSFVLSSCVLEIWCGWFWVVSVPGYYASPRTPNLQHTAKQEQYEQSAKSTA